MEESDYVTLNTLDNVEHLKKKKINFYPSSRSHMHEYRPAGLPSTQLTIHGSKHIYTAISNNKNGH